MLRNSIIPSFKVSKEINKNNKEFDKYDYHFFKSHRPISFELEDRGESVQDIIERNDIFYCFAADDKYYEFIKKNNFPLLKDKTIEIYRRFLENEESSWYNSQISWYRNMNCLVIQSVYNDEDDLCSDYDYINEKTLLELKDLLAKYHKVPVNDIVILNRLYNANDICNESYEFADLNTLISLDENYNYQYNYLTNIDSDYEDIEPDSKGNYKCNKVIVYSTKEQRKWSSTAQEIATSDVFIRDHSLDITSSIAGILKNDELFKKSSLISFEVYPNIKNILLLNVILIDILADSILEKVNLFDESDFDELDNVVFVDFNEKQYRR